MSIKKPKRNTGFLLIGAIGAGFLLANLIILVAVWTGNPDPRIVRGDHPGMSVDERRKDNQ